VITNSYVFRSDWVDGLELFGFLVVSIYVLIMTIIAGPVISLMTGSIVSAGVATGTWLAYKDSGLLIDPTFPLAGSFFVYLSMTSIRYFTADRQKRQIRRAFSQYVAPTVLQQIEKTPESLVLGGEMRIRLHGGERGFIVPVFALGKRKPVVCVVQRRAQVGRAVEKVGRRAWLTRAEQGEAHVHVRLGQRRIDCQDFVQGGNRMVELPCLQHGDALLETLVGAAGLLVAEKFVCLSARCRPRFDGICSITRQMHAQQRPSQHRQPDRHRQHRTPLVRPPAHMTPLCGATLRNGTPRKVRTARPKIATTADQP
jgi:hypothetical protein